MRAYTDLKLRVRRATPDDAAATADFLNALFAENLPTLFQSVPGATIQAQAQRVFIETLTADPRSGLWLAEQQDQLLGLLDFQAYSRPQQRHAGELGLSVAQRWRGRGVGGQLLQALLDWVERERQVSRVELRVFENNHGALKLYRRCGFQHEGRQRGAVTLHGQALDLLLMARRWPHSPAGSPA